MTASLSAFEPRESRTFYFNLSFLIPGKLNVTPKTPIVN